MQLQQLTINSALLLVRVYQSVDRKEDIPVFTLLLCILALPHGWSSKRDRDNLNPREQDNKALFGFFFCINFIIRRDPMNAL